MSLRIVSDQSEEIRRQQSHKRLKRDLRNFAANFLRLVSGFGRALDLLGQLEKVSAAIREYAEAHDGKLPPQKVIHGILDDRAALLENRPWIEEAEETERARWNAIGENARSEAIARMIRAGLRIAAASFVDQLTQRSAAESNFYEALFRLDEVRRETRKNSRSRRK